MTVNTFVVSWHHIANIVETHHYNRKLLEKLTNHLQNSSIEACRHLETILNINASQKNLMHKKEAGISLEYSEGPESEINEKQQTDSIEQHVQSYCESIIPIVEESQQDVANALVKNNNLKYRVNQIKIMNKRILFDYMYSIIFLVPYLITCFLLMCITLTLFYATLIFILYIVTNSHISYHWAAVPSKLIKPTYVCGAIHGFIVSFSDPSDLVTIFSYYSISRFFYSYFIGMTLALSRDVVWSSSNRNIKILAVFYSTVIALSWSSIALSSSTQLGITLGLITHQQNHISAIMTFFLYYGSKEAVLVPAMMGRFLGENTTVQCGYLFAAVSGGLTATLVATVLTSATYPLIDTDLSNAVPRLDKNIQKLRSLQGDLEEVQKRLKRSSLH